ncbi:MAG: FtsX-like permease family protein [Luteitalea sp.]|nr:FtsX-like permease family protein [Luteitalea sp.]
MGFRSGLFTDILGLAWDTLRANKLRSFLTILGVVIGVTSIVSMTSLVLGFEDSVKSLFRQMGTDTLYLVKIPFGGGRDDKEFLAYLRRPDITMADAEAIQRNIPSADVISMAYGAMGQGRQEEMVYGSEKTRPMTVFGVSEEWLSTNFMELDQGRFFTTVDVDRRRQSVVLGSEPARILFPNVDPIGKRIRVGPRQFTVVGVFGKRPSIAIGNPDQFAVMPYTTYAKLYDPYNQIRGIRFLNSMLAVVPEPGISRDEVIDQVSELMRARHRLRLDQENDFAIMTSDAMTALFDQITQGVFLALIIISSIALMVGGIGVMAIMTISVTERTREIGVRKAIGARRREILWQFLLEAVFLTSIGGLLGIITGASIALGVNRFVGWAVLMPWWSFAVGLAFSGTVGIVFGMLPAFKAARLDPIEALRYE